MAAYATPSYDYGIKANQLTLNKGLSDISADFGRFMNQERYRRSQGDAQREFSDRFPRVGAQYNRRGLWNSGLRKEGQQREAQDFQRGMDRMQYDFTANQAQADQSQALSDASYQQALLGLFDQMQRERAATYDPYAALRQLLGAG